MADHDAAATGEAVAVYSAVGACRWCDARFTRLPGRVKEFCCTKHRAAWRNAELQQALVLAMDALQNMADAAEQTAAACRGAAVMLERFRTKKPRTAEKK